MSEVPRDVRINSNAVHANSPRLPPPAYSPGLSSLPSVPSTPHPLQLPATPITPVFARPSQSPAPRDVKFAQDTIIRGDADDLLPKRGQRGDDFWRRFSIVAKQESARPKSQIIR